MLQVGIYKHFKGREYQVIGVAKHSETLEELVVYKSLENGELWVRPLSMFTQEVEANGQKQPRFVFVRENV